MIQGAGAVKVYSGHGAEIAEAPCTLMSAGLARDHLSHVTLGLARPSSPLVSFSQPRLRNQRAVKFSEMLVKTRGTDSSEETMTSKVSPLLILSQRLCPPQPLGATSFFLSFFKFIDIQLTHNII